MIQEECKQRLGALTEELMELEERNLPGVKGMVVFLAPVRKAITGLRELVLANGFSTMDEEIGFFKVWKPAFYGLQVYYVERATVEEQLPLGDGEARLVYLKQQLAFIDRFFRQQAFMYQYYRMGAVELDKVYFVRGGSPSDTLPLELPGADPEFTTAGDYLFARFMAYERLRDDLLELMVPRHAAAESFTSKKGKVLKWTGDTCNLIEVAYGIYDTLQLNDGDVDLTDIIDWLESTLNVNLSRFYRRFMEIKRRKVMSKTKYLDEMRAAVNKRIDDTDALQSEKRKSFRNH